MPRTTLGTDSKFELLAEVEIWMRPDGAKWDLWIGNSLRHLSSLGEVMAILEREVKKESEKYL